MSEDDSFTTFIRRIRAGDAQAAEELLRQYEPAIRMEVRIRLRDSRLRRVFDSMDFCQSVLGSFFVRAAAGEYDLEKPEQLLRLLVAIARNKVAYQARKDRAQRRDNRRVRALKSETDDAAASDPSPSQVMAGQELLQAFRQNLSPEERCLADHRARDHSWAEIAAELGGTPDGRRMQWARAVERVARQLGLEGAGHEREDR
jgi:RNA polymerase sigma-70 factor (ECF subfamily)